MKIIRKEKVDRTVFRITPHRETYNSESRKFQHVLYELLNTTHKKYPWQHKQGLFISDRPNPDMWWVMRIYSEQIKDDDGKETEQKQIEFYISIPSDFADAFITKFRNHKQWGKATIKETDDFIFPEDDNTDLYKLKYTKHDMFSLDFDYGQQTTPVRDLMNVSNDLKENEQVYMFIRTEPIDRGEWKKFVDYAWSVWDRGSVPYRSGLNISQVVSAISGGAVYFIYEVMSLLVDTVNAVGKVFMHGDEPAVYKPEKPKRVNADREELLVDGDLSRRTYKKRNLPTFATDILYTVTSPDPIRRDMIAKSVSTSYADLNGNNSLTNIKINIRAMKDIRDWRSSALDSNMMSTHELGKIQQLPTADLQREMKGMLQSDQRVDASVPEVFADETGIFAGTSTTKGVTQRVYIPTKDQDLLYTPRAICGSPRMGKDMHIVNTVLDAKKKHGIGAVIPDVVDERNKDRGMADLFRDHLPAEDVIDLDLGDTDNPIYLGLQSITKYIDDIRIASDRIAEEITDFLLDDEDADMHQTYTYLMDASKIAQGDPQSIKLMFTSKVFRQQMMEEYKDIFDMTLWEDFNRLSEKQQSQLFAPIMKRLRQMESEFLKPIFFQKPNPAIDLWNWIAEGKVVVFRIPTKKISDRAVKILIYWIVLNVFLIKKAMDGIGAGTFLVLNEPHQFLSKGLVRFIDKMLKEGPKYKLSPMVIFHDLSQFKNYSGLTDALFSSTLNWHLLRNTNDKVYDRLMPYLSGTFATKQDAFEATKRRQYIACWLGADGSYEQPFLVDCQPHTSECNDSFDNANLTKEHSVLYGRPVNDVLNEIKDRNKIIRHVAWNDVPKDAQKHMIRELTDAGMTVKSADWYVEVDGVKCYSEEAVEMLCRNLSKIH